VRRALFGLLFVAGCAGTPPLPSPPKPPEAVPWPSAVASTAPIATTPDAPFRDQPPQAGAPVAFVAPKIESFALKNGIKVLFVERHDLPIVTVEVELKVGAGDLAGVRPGVMSLTAAMMEQGTEKRTALQISDEYEALGAEHGTVIDWDSGGSYVKCLPSQLDRALDLMSDVILHPTFPEGELERLRTRRLGSLQQEKNNPRAMAQNALVAALYGRAHPYGNALIGRIDEVKKITRADLVAAHKREFSPANAAIIVAGDVTREDLEKKLETAFGAWKGGAAERANALKAPAPKKGTPRIIVVDRPGAQSQVMVAQTGVPMSTPDRDALSVMNAVLGGMFSSRINLNLREAHAYTYGAYSRWSLRHGPGPFVAGGSIFAEKTVDAIKEVLKEIDRIRAEAVTADELADAKEYLRLGMPGRFETVSAIGGAVGDLFVYGLPLDEYATRQKRIDAITAADVQRVAKALLHPDELRIIVVGDRKKLEDGLKGLGLGDIEARDAYGDVLP
jgi:predicted Zn-dependent peptidase